MDGSVGWTDDDGIAKAFMDFDKYGNIPLDDQAILNLRHDFRHHNARPASSLSSLSSVQLVNRTP